MNSPTITDPQLMNVEGCIRNALQKINRVRAADTELRRVAANSGLCPSALLQSAESEGRHADFALVAALDELKDELQKLPLAVPLATWPPNQTATKRFNS